MKVRIVPEPEIENKVEAENQVEAENKVEAENVVEADFQNSREFSVKGKPACV